jgi:RNA polymerase sigma-70 factor (ECF subfamily)
MNARLRERGMAAMSDARCVGRPFSVPFPEVYRTYFGFVWRTLHRMRVREADLLDLAQNVFVIVHRRLPGFEGRSEVTTWLYAICRRVARDYLRSARVRREVLVDVREAGVCGALREGTLHRLDSQELSHLLESILSRIPDKQREVFVMFELDELSGDEIAHLLDVPVGTVRSRLRLARATFQRHVRSLRERGVDAASALGLLAGAPPTPPATSQGIFLRRGCGP